MSNTMKRTLSLLLALVMAFSLAEPAYAVGLTTGEGDLTVEQPSVQPKDEIISDGDPIPVAEPEQPGDAAEEPATEPVELPGVSDWISDFSEEGKLEGKVDSREDPFGAEDIPLSEPEDAFPERTFTFSDEDGFTVEVYAPEGALPADTEMHVTRLTDLAPVQTVIDNAENLNGSVQLAADISFTLFGKEIEPAEGSKLVVKMSAPEIEGIAAPVVVHIPDGENAVPEIIEQLSSGDLLMADTLSFEASDFSVYVVLEPEQPGDEARLAINFRLPDGEGEDGKGTIIKTVYIKNGDMYWDGTGTKPTGKSLINDIVYDPGLGDYDLGTNMFRGWTIDELAANPTPAATEEDPYPAQPPYGAQYDSTTKVYTVDDITKYLSGKLGSIKEGDELDIYAMIFVTYTISYFGNSTTVSMGNHIAYATMSQTNANYTIDMIYTPENNTTFFEGWKIMSGADNIVSAVDPDGNTITGRVTVSEERPDADPPVTATIFPNGSKLVVKGDVQFALSAPEGHWLIFKENGKGATYNAPQFVKNGKTTTEPASSQQGRMLRNGYTFQGWYEVECDYDEGKAIPKTDANGDFIFKSNSPFVFGNPLTEETVVAAKWEAVAKARYVVIFWGQKIESDDEYDFISSQTIDEGNVGSTINVTHTTTSVSVTGATSVEIPTGFEFGSADTGKTIAPEGNTVVNVYLNRKVYTLTFTVTASNYISYVYNNTTYNDATISDEITDEESLAILDGEEYASYRKEVGGDVIFSFTTGNGWNQTTYYYIKNNGKWYQITDEGYYVYNSTQILRFPSSGGTVKTIKAKYGTVISDNFPIIGDDGVAYVHGERWKPGSNSLGWSEVMCIIDTMREDNVTFTLDVQKRPLKTMYYYVEALDTDTDTVTWKGDKYVLYTDEPIRARYNGVTAEDFIELHGFTKIAAADANGNVLTPHSIYGLDGEYYIGSTTQDQSIYFYYSRNKYDIVYMDGVYVDGNNNILKDYASQGQWKVVEDVLFESDTTSYNKGGENFYNPQNEARAVPGFVFEGWYLDDACLTPYTFDEMPFGGIQVYAKWRQEQYRVFLRTNVPTSDNTLDWGSDDQSMNFRIDRGGYVSTPTGLREHYVFVGWYLDETFDQVFDAERVPLTEDVVKTNYDKTLTENMTDNQQTWTNPKTGKVENKPINKWGVLENNDPGVNKDKDNDRFWITKKLDLYAKWKAVLDKADGISVIYDEVPGNTAGHGVEGTAPNDGGRLYEDNSKAIAQAASTAAMENERFLYWVVQKWNKDDQKWENVMDDKGDLVTVQPGDNFLVKAEYAKITPADDGTKNFYQVQLRAAYGSKDGPEPTHINFYANNATGQVESHTELGMNEAIDIPTPENYRDEVIDHSKIDTRDGNETTEPIGLHNNGCIFLGWAKLEKRSDGKVHSVVTDEVVTDTSELNDADLWLKWVEPGENETAGHYLYRTGDTWTVAADVTNASQVAADEYTPYQDLYAVWQRTFFVYHTATGKVERVALTSAVNTVNLTELVDTDHYLYGGYYKAYSGASDTFKADPAELAWTQVASIDAYGSNATINTLAAQGIVSTATDSGNGFKTYTAANINAAAFTWGDAYTTRGDQVIPINDVKKDEALVYYIKEVPIENYLRPNLKFTYSTSTEQVGTIWLVSGVDDGSYTEAGFFFNNKYYKYKEATDSLEGGFMDEIVFHPVNHNDDNSKDMICNYNNQCGEYGITRGKLYYRCVFNLVSAGATVVGNINDGIAGEQIGQYWVTPDGAYVTGKYTRAYTGVENKSTFQPVNYDNNKGCVTVGTSISFTAPTYAE